MTQIVAFYKTIFLEANFELEGRRSDNLRARIERHYGQDMEFYKVRRKHTIFVCSSSVLGGQLNITPSPEDLA